MSEGWKNKEFGREKTLESLNFLVDTEKLRSFKLFSNTIKNGGYYMETSFFQQFFFGMGKLITW